MASKLNKKDLYEEYKKIRSENNKLNLFLHNSDDVRNKQKIVMECQEKEIEELHENLEVLNQENRKLKENGGYVDEGCSNHMASILKDDIIKDLQEQNFHLKEGKKHYEEKFIKERDENRRIGLIDLKEIHYKQMEKDVENYKEQIKKLQEEIKLKDEIISLHEQDEKDS